MSDKFARVSDAALAWMEQVDDHDKCEENDYAVATLRAKEFVNLCWKITGPEYALARLIANGKITEADLLHVADQTGGYMDKLSTV